MNMCANDVNHHYRHPIIWKSCQHGYVVMTAIHTHGGFIQQMSRYDAHLIILSNLQKSDHLRMPMVKEGSVWDSSTVEVLVQLL